jgi:hypothetical protein
MRTEVHIQSIDCEYFPDVSSWHASILPYYEAARRGVDAEVVDAAVAEEAAAAEATGDAAAGETASTEAGATSEPAAEAPPTDAGTDAAVAATDDATTTEPDATPIDPAADPAVAAAVDPVTGLPVEGAAGAGLTGEGWIIELCGYHLHNSLDEPNQPKVELRGDEGWMFVRNTLIKNLEDGTVQLPDGPNGELIDVPLSELGIKYPVVLTSFPIKKETYLPEAVDESMNGGSMPSASYDRRGGEEIGMRGEIATPAGPEAPKNWVLRRYDFLVQFCWQPQPRGKRLEKMAGAATGAAPSTAATNTDAANTRDSS